MNWLNLTFLIVSSLQLLTTYVTAESNATEDAIDDLFLLNIEIQLTSAAVSLSESTIWKPYVNDISELLQDQLTNDIQTFATLVDNLILFVDNSSKIKCISPLDTFLDLDNYKYIDVVSMEEEIVRNLISQANVSVQNIADQYTEINTEFITICLQNGTNCEGISKSVVAEARRLAPILERILYQLTVEIHLLGYKLGEEWANVRSNLLIYYTKGIQNTTTCLASEIQATKQETLSPASQMPKDIDDDIMNSYADLVTAAVDASLSSVDNLDQLMTNVRYQINIDYNDTNKNIYDTTSRANSILQSLLDVVLEFNSLVNCSAPSFDSILNSSLSSSHYLYIVTAEYAEAQYHEAYSNIHATMDEAKSIGREVVACFDNAGCEYIFEKLELKTVEVPWLIQRMEKSSSAPFYQINVSVRAAGSKIVRDALEKLEYNLIRFKNCILEPVS